MAPKKPLTGGFFKPTNTLNRTPNKPSPKLNLQSESEHAAQAESKSEPSPQNRKAPSSRTSPHNGPPRLPRLLTRNGKRGRKEEDLDEERPPKTKSRRRQPSTDQLQFNIEDLPAKETCPSEESHKPHIRRDGHVSSKTYHHQNAANKRSIESLDTSSEDELNVDEASLNVSKKKKRQSAVMQRNKRTPLPRPPTRPREDMQKTHFKPSHENMAIKVTRACSGNYIYVAEKVEEAERVTLVLTEANTLTPVDSAGKRSPLHWMECNISTFIILIALEFASQDDCEKFRKWVNSRLGSPQNTTPNFNNVKRNDVSGERMWRIFDRKYEESVSRIGHFGPLDAGDPPDDEIQFLERQERKREQIQQLKSPLVRSSQRSQGFQPKMKDAMRVNPAPTDVDADQGGPKVRTLRTRQPSEGVRETRQFRKSSPLKSPSPTRWTDTNAWWNNLWDSNPLIYPEMGKNKAQVTKEDIPRLNSGEFLNDNLILFYQRYLENTMLDNVGSRPDKETRTYFMTTWFYSQLCRKRGAGIDYDAVKSWTSKVDLFSYDYIVVPVNEACHWYMAIICHPSKLLSPGTDDDAVTISSQTTQGQDHVDNADGDKPHRHDTHIDDMPMVVSDTAPPKPGGSPKTSVRHQASSLKAKTRNDPEEFRVVTLDSQGLSRSPVCINLREYLVQEAKDKKGRAVEPPPRVGLTAKGLPLQSDGSSCGAFLLGYLEKFLDNPDEVIRKVVLKEDLVWEIDPEDMRRKIRDALMEMRQQQNERETAKRAAKAAAKMENKAAASAGVTRSPPAAQATPGTRDPTEAYRSPKTSHSDPPDSGWPGQPQLPDASGNDDRQSAATNASSLEPVQSPHNRALKGLEPARTLRSATPKAGPESSPYFPCQPNPGQQAEVAPLQPFRTSSDEQENNDRILQLFKTTSDVGGFTPPQLSQFDWHKIQFFQPVRTTSDEQEDNPQEQPTLGAPVDLRGDTPWPERQPRESTVPSFIPKQLPEPRRARSLSPTPSQRSLQSVVAEEPATRAVSEETEYYTPPEQREALIQIEDDIPEILRIEQVQKQTKTSRYFDGAPSGKTNDVASVKVRRTRLGKLNWRPQHSPFPDGGEFRLPGNKFTFVDRSASATHDVGEAKRNTVDLTGND